MNYSLFRIIFFGLLAVFTANGGQLVLDGTKDPLTVDGTQARLSINEIILPSEFSDYFSVDLAETSSVSRGAQLTGASDSKLGLLSFWMKMNASSSDFSRYQVIRWSNGYVDIHRGDNGEFQITGFTSVAQKVLDIFSSNNSIRKVDGWVHVLASWDLATTTTHLYINGVSDITISAAIDGAINYTVTNVWVGTNGSGSFTMDGLFCEFYFTNEYLDISSSANREKFRTSGGKPVDLGADGSTPTGTAPWIYLREEVPAWESNQGSGGGMTEAGTIADGGADKP